MSTEHVVFEGGSSRAPITLDVTCSRCWLVYRYDVKVTTVVNQLLADEGWQLPDVRQICATCVREIAL